MSEVKVNKISPRSGTDVTLGDSGDNFIIPSGATLTNNGNASGFASIAWQSAIKTASFTAVAGEGYWVNTTSGAITITLPASASVGDQIIFTDYARTWATNAVTVNQNSLNFQGYTSPNPEYNTSGQSVNIVYSGATQGWIPNSDDDVTDKQSYSADFLVIAGGASGGRAGSNSAGGGGAGGYRNSYSTETSGGGGSSETSLTLSGGTVYTITIGSGGAARTSGARGDNGIDSSISGSDITTITSAGGGGGASQNINGDGIDGGSGGGASYGSTGDAQSGGAGTANQGFRGGNKQAVGSGQGCGGGGAGAQGVDATTGASEATNGGDGLASSITGSSVTRAGGGAGVRDDTVKSGGAGGGGDSSISGTAGSGTTNTGSGGGACSSGTSGAGGSGVVILRFPTANYSGTTTGSPTVSTDGTDTILTFTASGSYTG
jgi:hypothetical protein